MTERQTHFFVIVGAVLLLIFFVFLLWILPANGQTTMGPIRTPQVNQELYVGQISFPTIQSAITFACATGNHSYAVVILPGVVTTDSPGSVTGGCYTSYIADLHTTPLIYYSWNGSAYVLNSQTATSDFARQSATVLNFTGTVHIASGTVANSPICTQTTGCPGSANGGSFTWPPIGIAVSAGSSWGNSIDPNALPAPGTNQQVLINSNGVISATSNLTLNSLSLTGPITSTIGTRLPTGTDLNTINTCGDFDGFNFVNGPPQIPVGTPYLNNIGVHVWCTNDPTYFVQLAWNMTQYNQPTEIYARNNRAGTWTAWSLIIMDDGSGVQNLKVNNTLTTSAGGTLMGITGNRPLTSADVPNTGGWMHWNAYVGTGETDFTNIRTPSLVGGFNWYDTPYGSLPNFTQPLMRLDNAGNLTIRGTLIQSAGFFSLPATRAPTSSKSKCRKNAMWHDEDFMYVCVKNGEIKRAALAAF